MTIAEERPDAIEAPRTDLLIGPGGPLGAGDDIHERSGAAAGRAPKPPRSARPPRPPKPPRRAPRPPRQLAPLSRNQAIARGALSMLAALLLGFAINLMILSHLQHQVNQQKLQDAFRVQLSTSVAPVSEGDSDGALLADGAPVARIDIPALGMSEVIAEGSSSGVLQSGPGHRRDTVLPGQQGISVVMGRASSYGGPFGGIQRLAPGDRITVVTGQGANVFEVIGTRYAGDPAPAPPAAGQSRLILETARGAAFVPSGVVRVDAQLVGDAQPAGKRQTTAISLPPSHKELATDTSTVWALVFAGQFFLAISLGAVWSFRRLGARKTWVVAAPLFVLGGLLVADQVTRLLPNLL
ncbi:sortase [Okibacterium fritillariae]|uniref:Sortase (Surface protein transpeptidase) n=1 Tax=Okibacterium fritillariae TaxID=123320 RepID=A0A1T5JQ50_9MICO|nr:sortase [Okibacterium fritillariae]SKC53567.1 Sortase (surface protein transpeptidase) [Okibacterium fritillariae]